MLDIKYFKDLDFEEILSKLPDRFQDTDLHRIVPATQEIADRIAPDIANMHIPPCPMETATIFYAGDVAKIMMDLGLIEPDFDSPEGLRLEIWFRKIDPKSSSDPDNNEDRS